MTITRKTLYDWSRKRAVIMGIMVVVATWATLAHGQSQEAGDYVNPGWPLTVYAYWGTNEPLPGDPSSCRVGGQ